jgi:sugar O-acyltransferase (sialic acid O-acetyltransferase NeuD family)
MFDIKSIDNLLFVGCKRHAKDLLYVLQENHFKGTLNVFDDVSRSFNDAIDYSGELFQDEITLKKYLKKNPYFILALGGTESRRILNDKLTKLGGILISICSKQIALSESCVKLGPGLNIMPFAFIGGYSSIGLGTIIHTHSSIHHDVEIGNFCEISPGARILGGSKIGDFTTIGAGAVVLPDIKIGQNVSVGSGSIITKDIPDSVVVYGVPGAVKKRK